MSQPITASAITETHGWTASRRGDVDHAVRKAGRHSIVVRLARIALPAGVVLGLAVLLVATYFQPMQMFEKMPTVSGKLGVQGSTITMELPRIAGFTRDARSYEINAETAVQDITKPDLVELQKLRARIEMQDKDVVQITANSGTYNTKADRVVLRDQVVVTSEQGYKAQLREAAVEMKKGNVVSELPVEITLPNGLLKANRMEIVESGDVIRFENGVVLDLDGEKKEALR
ncbi:MAG: LPS export ABC transporter periplasmic protein LptC [Alphaproteobacteria bacterium]|nr:MAG: LPS export ABC transporter periplasmic protein LptC [Alphaproteobacteria bacterium]